MCDCTDLWPFIPVRSTPIYPRPFPQAQPFPLQLSFLAPYNRFTSAHAPVTVRYPLTEYISHPLVTACRDPLFQVSLGSLDHVIMPIARLVLNILPLNIIARVFSITGMSGDVSSPLFVPFHYGKMGRGHKSLPPAYFQVCGIDLYETRG
jgi:hypothetical protein